MGQLGGRRDSWMATARRIAAAPHAPAMAGVLLGLAALAEVLTRLRLDSSTWFGSAMAGSTPVGATGSIARTGGAGVGWQSALVLCLLALASTVPLALLRPSAAAATVTAASVLSLTASHSLTIAGGVAQLVVLHRLGRTGSQLLAVLLAAPFLVLALGGAADSEIRILTLLLASLGPVAAWAGAARRARHDAVQHSAARRAIAGTLWDHTARGERARIVRELHDVVAHHVSMIAVQAETARLTTPGMPAEGARRLSSIGDTARAALTEMRRLLGVLRQDTRADPRDRQPQPGLRQLNELIDEARDASGTVLRLIVRGRPAGLDPGVELAAYRIVQEALTNARRHAPGAAVDVELHYAADALWLRIRDNGPGPADTGTPGGHGLLGMRERAAAVGGELRTEAARGGGFLVQATLPARSEEAA